MEGPPRSTKRSERINKQQVANHVISMVEELQDTTHVVEISTESTAHIERSIFYRDDVKRVYQLNPKEHPGLIGVLDTIFENIKTRTGIDLTRTTSSEGYLLTITTEDTDSLGKSATTPSELRDHGVYSSALSTAITTQPFARYDTSFNAGISNEVCRVEETTSQHLYPTVDDVTHEIPVKGWFENTEQLNTVFAETIACEKMVLTQQHVSTNLAKLIAVLDSIAFIREHPLITNSVANQYPFEFKHNLSNSGTTDETLFSKKCDDFLLETAPGWRLRWIVETILTDPKPLENISDAANISVEEAEITLSLMSQWGIVTEHVKNGEKCYKLASAYQGWKNKSPDAGFQITEPSYLVNNSSPEAVIDNSFQVLCESV